MKIKNGRTLGWILIAVTFVLLIAGLGAALHVADGGLNSEEQGYLALITVFMSVLFFAVLFRIWCRFLRESA